jgi:hypothetical protein
MMEEFYGLMKKSLAAKEIFGDEVMDHGFVRFSLDRVLMWNG